MVFGRTAETCAQYLKKGQNVLVEGRMQTRSWDDKTSGQKKYRTEIVADRVQFGNKPSGTGAPSAAAANGSASKAAPQEPAPLDTIEYPQEDVNVDDIPF